MATNTGMSNGIAVLHVFVPLNQRTCIPDGFAMDIRARDACDRFWRG
jgi:hypothetical protein